MSDRKPRFWFQCPVCLRKTWGHDPGGYACLDGHESTPMTRCVSTRDWPHGKPANYVRKWKPKAGELKEAVRRTVLGGSLVVELTDQGITFVAADRQRHLSYEQAFRESQEVGV